MNDVKSYMVGKVTITRHTIDWNDVEGSVQRRLAAPASETKSYVNPMFTVTAPADCPTQAFVKQARRAQIIWNKRLARVLGTGNRKRQIKTADPDTRQLKFTGIMVLNGARLPPKGWPDVKSKQRVQR